MYVDVYYRYSTSDPLQHGKIYLRDGKLVAEPLDRNMEMVLSKSIRVDSGVISPDTPKEFLEKLHEFYRGMFCSISEVKEEG